jgi:hypothetical protein
LTVPDADGGMGWGTDILGSVIPAKGVQRHVTLKHDLTLTVCRTGEIPAFAGMTMQ